MYKVIETKLIFRFTVPNERGEPETIMRPDRTIKLPIEEIPRQGDEVFFHPIGGSCRVLSVTRHYARVSDDVMSLNTISHVNLLLESLDTTP